MANVWFLGDLHLGHKNIHKYRPRFTNAEEHDAYMKEAYHKVVGKRDVVFFMGDTAFTKETLGDMKTWQGSRKIIITGNHDLERGITMRDLCDTYDEVYAFRKYKEFWLSHPPIHVNELRGRVNIHGHVHYASVEDPRYFNTSMEAISYRPISLEEIRSRIAETEKARKALIECLIGRVDHEAKAVCETQNS